ncbi:hypothetical protein H072_8824 [Dactylellina haptotyla CBS 200.50]|uniref:Uncharacterized protein n=1 Tax=Dactylellina haptotyla (strain CBS 200.50) TaxID=1284197 RepID=S8A3E3_DACHA|nr:hypothetical protein H072_8824 [Dactylellina haptotyla CBS 200.50]
MKFSTLLFPLLSLAALSQAAPVDDDSGDDPIEALEARDAYPGQSTSMPTFTISDFYASGASHSSQIYIGFKVKSNPFGQTATCSFSMPLDNNHPVPTTNYYTKCKPSSFGFGFQKDATTKAYILTITQNTGKNLLTSAVSMENKIKTYVNKANPNGNYKYLDHSKKFTLYANLFLADFHEFFRHLYNNEIIDSNALTKLAAKAKTENRPIRIADLGAGTGAWALDIAQTFTSKPGNIDVELDCYDITDAKFPSEPPNNIQFKIWDVNESPTDEMKGRYDYVHMRLLVAFLPITQIPVVLKHAMSLLAPGGYLDWSDVSPGYPNVTPTNPNTQKCALTFVEHLKVTGKDPYLTDNLEDWIRGVGFQTVKSTHYSTDIIQKLPPSINMAMTICLVPATYAVLLKLISSLNPQLRSAALVRDIKEAETVIAASEEEIKNGATFTIPVSRFLARKGT